MAKMGRPLKPESKRLKHGFRVRVNDNEKRLIETYAKKHNITNTEAIREGIKKLKESEER